MAMFAASLMFLTALISIKPANRIRVNRVSNPIIQHGIGKIRIGNFMTLFIFLCFIFICCLMFHFVGIPSSKLSLLIVLLIA